MQLKMAKPNKNNIYLWTGNGGGKTTSALGTALRCIGHNQKVIVVQFMKGRTDIGEYKIMDKLNPNYQIYQFGTKEFIKPLNKAAEKHKELAKLGLAFAKICADKKPFLLILDEINLACSAGLLDVNEAAEVVDYCSKHCIVYLTGRNAPKKLKDIAGFVNEIKLVKQPKKYTARKGIEW
jgi:cob(I)alamin adenosyltransferase